ncbi:MAG: hypothetical protein JXL80_17495 [Planctomycetes bacterium]|nr:hypothetical protein [Planctomycetota bacterium]
MADELLETIQDNASAPAEATDEAGSMKQHTLRDQIALHKHVAAAKVAANPVRALRMVKIVPGGSV